MYDYYWATYSAESTGLNGMAYNELVRHCHITGSVWEQLRLNHISTNSGRTSAGHRRRSSFPPQNAHLLADEEVDISSGSVLLTEPSVQSHSSDLEAKSLADGSMSGEANVNDKNSPLIRDQLLRVSKGAKKVIAMSPRCVIILKLL